MKRILSTLLVAAMLLSLVIVAAVPASAADGDWTTYATASAYAEGAEKGSIPGYKYEGGAKMVPADFTGQTPFGTIQTKNKVNLKDGLYMEVRIDEFSWDAKDEWININLWNQPMIEPGSTAYGKGFQTLLRNTYTPATDDAPESAVLKVSNQLRDVYYIKGFSGARYTEAELAEKKEAVIDLLAGETIKFDVRYKDGKYTISINGVPAPQKANDYLAEAFKDGMAYVGVTLQNNTTGGKAACTITKFGTSADKATAPSGDDYKDPVNVGSQVAPIADPSTVEAGKPAVFLNGDLANSDLGAVPKSIKGTDLSTNDDFSVRMTTSAKSTVDCGLSVKSAVSYDIKDFPYAMVLMKNFCTCDDPTCCIALEIVSMYLMCGDDLAVDGKVRIDELEKCWDPLVVEEDTTVNGVEIEAGNYLYFYFNCLDASFNPEGRINNVIVEMSGMKVAEDGRNFADMVFTGFFRTEEEGVAYVYDYLGLEKPNTDGGEDTDETTEPEEDTTVDGGEDTTVGGGEDTTVADDEDTTAEKGEVTTADKSDDDDKKDEETKKDDDKKDDDKKDDDKNDDDKKGCGSVVGTGVVAIVAVVTACGFVSFKKKED